MKVGDLVYLKQGWRPTVGEIVGFTPKRVRVAIRNHLGYTSVIRSRTTIKLAKRIRSLA